MLARAICLMLLVHFIRFAASRIFCTAGRSRPIRMAMMAMTTSSSIRVNPRRERERIAPSFPRVRGGRTPDGKKPRLAAGRNASWNVEIELVRAVLGHRHFLPRLHVPVRRTELPADDGASARSGRFVRVHRVDGCLSVAGRYADDVLSRFQSGRARDGERATGHGSIPGRALVLQGLEQDDRAVLDWFALELDRA